MMVRAARTPGDRDFLIAVYLPAIRQYLVQIRRLRSDIAEELSQEFAAQKFLAKNIFAAVGQERGKFRTYLLRSLDHFLIDSARAADPDRGLGGGEDAIAGSHAAAALSDPVVGFERAWGKNVITVTLARVHQYCLDQGRQDVWRVFEGRLVAPAADGAPVLSYEMLAKELGLTTPMQAANLLVTGKRMFERELREVIREYAGDDADFAEELSDLKRILTGGAESARFAR